MKKAIISAAFALLAGPAFAQDHHDHEGAAMQGPRPQAGAPAQAAPHAGGGMAAHRGPQAPLNLPAQARTRGMPQQAGGGDHRGDRGGDNNPMNDALRNATQGNGANNAAQGQRFDNNDRRGRDDNRGNNNGMRGNAMGGNAMMGGNRAGRGGNWNQYHRNFSAPRRYHASQPYRRPSGWYAHRWSYGETLPSAFFLRDYWINDFDDYGLMDPPYGAVWVRYGDDALLIDQSSGEVIQVEYGVFY